MNTILIIIEQSCLFLPLIVGAYISISLLKLPDLSIESAYVFGAIVGANMVALFSQAPTVLVLLASILASMVGGACVGIISSCMTRYIPIPHLLSSIITFGLFHGINQVVLQGTYLSLTNYHNPLEYIPGTAQHPELSMVLIISAILISMILFFFRTQLAYACAIIGNNGGFFKNYATSTNFVVIMGVMIGNALAGLSGYLFAQSNNFVEITIGQGKLLLCITSLILGKALLMRTARITLWVPVLGTGCYFMVQQLLLQGGFNLKYFTTVQALLVLIFIIIQCRIKRCDLGNQLGV
jgi:putative tryptophan/tyrosine transport system permease protein